jgi:DNA-binding SARP family transcriptional activator/tetratricopeptide (TPR) repeat protein
MGVRIRLLGDFAVTIDDERVPDAAWQHTRPRELVQLLALAPHHRLPREQVLDALWPTLDPTPAGANLHKAASLARRATGDAGAVSLSKGLVALFPETSVETDVERFEQAAHDAIRREDAPACESAARLYTGDLLPDQPYTSWSEADRRRLQGLCRQLLNQIGDHHRIIELDPLDEPAQMELMRTALESGRPAEALHRYADLARACRDALGTAPGPQARALRDEAARSAAPAPRRGPMVGRNSELAALRTILVEAQNGTGRCLLIEGEAGIGKTRLVQQLVAEAADAGWPVARAIADASTAVPYLPLVTAVRRLLQQRPDLAHPAPGDVCTRLDELTRQAGAGPPLSAARDGHLEDVASVLTDVLTPVDAASPALLVLDDAHAADVATLDLVWQLGQLCLEEPLVVVLAHRAPPPGSALDLLRARLLQRGAHQLRLSPLARVDAEELVRRSASHRPKLETTERLVGMGGGNPFLLLELSALVSADGSAATPERLEDAAVARLGGVSGQAAVALERVAVVHMRFSQSEFAAVAEVAEDVGRRLIEECLRQQILVRAGDGYCFRHDLVRESFAGLVPPRRRQALHREAAARLIASGGQPGAIAHQLERSPDPGAATPWLLRAAVQAAEVGAFGDAVQLANRGLVHTDRPEAPELLEVRADALQALGDPIAPTSYSDARRAAGPEHADRLLVKQAHAFLTLGDIDAAEVCLDAVTAEPASGDLILLLLARGFVAWLRGRAEEARQLADDARRIALREARSFEASEALLLDALVAHSTGEWRLSRLPQVVRDVTMPELTSKAWDPHLCIGIYLVSADEPFDELAGLLRDAAARAAERGAVRGEAFSLTVLGAAAVYAGHLDEATTVLSRALRLQRRCGSSAGQSIVLERMAALEQMRGNRSKAEQLLTDGELMARSSTLTSHLLSRLYATRIQGASSPDEGLRLVDLGERDLRDREMCRGCSPLFLLAAAGTCVLGGQPERAAGLLETVRGMGPGLQAGAWGAAINEVEAGLAMSRGAATDAATLLHQAADGYRRAGHLVAADRCAQSLTTARKVSGRFSS